jgi:hypothetical protein
MPILRCQMNCIFEMIQKVLKLGVKAEGMASFGIEIRCF